MKTPTNLKFSRLLLFFLLITAGSSLPIQAEDALTEITLGSSEISFSDFSNIGSGYDTNIQGAFPASDKKDYSGWTKNKVQYVSSIKTVAKFASYGGSLTSPTITSQYGFTVTITYSSRSNSQVQIGTEDPVSGPTTTSPSDTGTGLTMSASTSATSTTFTITNTGNSNVLYVSKITITPKTSPSGGSETTKTEPGISFAQKSYTATLGQAFESPVLNNPNKLSGIIYTSSNQSVAKVDGNGKVSPLATGTTTITASFKGNETYAAGTASYTLTVQQAATPTATTFYKHIKSTEVLVDGNVCLLYCPNNRIMASSHDAVEDWIASTGTITLENDSVYTGAVNADGQPYEITITQREGRYALYTSDTYLEPVNTETKISTSSTVKYSWTIKFKTTGTVSIQNPNDNNSSRAIGYDTSSSFFKNMPSGRAVKLFQKQTTLKLKEAAEGWATYYNKGFAYVMPQGVNGYYVTLDQTGENLSLTLAYKAGDAVPENTPLLLYGKSGTYHPVIVNKQITPFEGINYMAGERDAEGNTSAGENMLYYKLTLDDIGENIGFYYGADNGAAFKMTNETTAYLALPKKAAQRVRSLILNPESITHLNLTATPTRTTASGIYDLSGRRIQRPASGWYIIDGVKVFAK